MNKLLEGYQRFRDGVWPQQKSLYSALAAGQNPRAVVLSCCDSRTDPATIFDAMPGELFVIRNVANLVPPYKPDADYHGTSAALEFAVCGLGIPDIIVLGHSQCGGINALLQGDKQPSGDFIAPWMSIATAARTKALTCTEPQQQLTTCAQESIRLSLANLMTFPWIAAKVRDGQLKLHGGYFDIATGQLSLLDTNGRFITP